MNSSMYRQQDMAVTNANFMSKVYLWMMIGLLLSGLVAYQTASSPSVMAYILQNKIIFFGLIIAQLAAVFSLSAFINRMSALAATFLYLGYAALTGLTFSTILLAFTAASISQAFFITAFSFTGLSIFGYVTKRDLGPVGSFCMMGLFGLVGFMLISMIFPSVMSSAVEMTVNVCAIIIFAGLTAYDTQKIKGFNVAGAAPDVMKKQALLGALMLYLDFINLFIFILNITGDRR